MQAGDLVADRYELEELLGTGGMSSVYCARDRVLERRVALKVLHDQYSGDEEYVERFRREAQAIARLSHPNIVTVIDRGEFEGCQFIVFEYIPGETLKDIVADEAPLPVAHALALVHQAARGLAYAHENGIVHRDVKPQNVLVDSEGVAKVTDFGIARSADREELTLPGTIMGTSDYISPEQASGERVDERSDQYSLGVLLYELLTGNVPYPGDSMVSVAMRHLHDPVPSVREERPDVSTRVDAVIRRAMAKHPEERFPSTDALIAALEVCMGDEATAGAPADGDTEVIGASRASPLAPPAPRRRPQRPPRRRAGGWRLPVALVVLLLGAVAVAIIASEGPEVIGGDGSSAAAQIRLRAVSDYDPEGDNRSEHPDEVPLATDRDPETYWTTESYNSFRKSGVGIVLDAGQPVELGALTIISDESGFDAVIQASDRRNGGFEEVSEEQVVGDRTRFELDTGGDEFRYYLIWITDLERRAHINEVRPR